MFNRINSVIFIQLCLLEFMKLKEEKKGIEAGISPKKTPGKQQSNLGIGKNEVAGYVKIGGNMILSESNKKPYSPQRNVI